MSTHEIARIGAVLNARREMLAYQTAVTLLLMALFWPQTGAIPALGLGAAYLFVQVTHHYLFEADWSQPEKVPLYKVVWGLAYLAASNATLAGFGLAQALNGGVWGLLCGALVWSGMVMFCAVLTAGSIWAGLASIGPPLACFLAAPVLVLVNGGSPLAAGLVLGAGLLNMLSTLGVWSMVGRLFDIQQRERYYEETLFTGSETGLPTRYAFISHCLDVLKQRPDEAHAVMVFEVNRHTRLRAALGFETFCSLMVAAADRLSAAAGGAMVAQLSSNTLGLLMPERDVASACVRAEDLRRCFDEPLMAGEVCVDVSTTVGVAMLGEPGQSLRHATVAIEHARSALQPVCAYDASADADPEHNLALMSRMMRAMSNGQMSLHYQPKLDLMTGDIREVEALCRWHDSELGWIPTCDFIAMAEETGHIRALSDWVLKQAVQDQAWMHAEGRRLGVAVNISGALLKDEAFAGAARALVADAVGPVTFEITETAVIEDHERALGILHAWVKAGIRVAIDDYGTGLSSLSYLKTLPAHELKLDRAIAHDVAASSKDALLVKSTVSLAHALGLKVTAEGIEDAEAIDLLRLFGCDAAQGYVIARPMPVPDLLAYLERTGARMLDVKDVATSAANQSVRQGGVVRLARAS